MTKREIERVQKLKKEMILRKRRAEYPKSEFEALPEYKRRMADQDYGYAIGVYAVLSALGCADEYPKFNDIS